MKGRDHVIMKFFYIPNFSNYCVTKVGDIYEISSCKRIFVNNSFTDLPQAINDEGVLVYLNTYNIASSFYGRMPGSSVVQSNGSYDICCKSISFKIISNIKSDSLTRIINEIEFKQIPHFSRYYVSRYGVIYSEISKSFKRLNASKNYLIASLTDDTGKILDRYVHHLVYEAFIGTRTVGKVIDHINEKKWDNSVENLQEITYGENTLKSRDALSKSYTDQMWNNVSRLWSNDLLHWLCEQMAVYNRSASDICDLLGATSERDRTRITSMLFSLRSGRSNRSIASQYDFSNYNANLLKSISNRKYSEPVYHAITYLKNEGKSNGEIGKILNIPRQTIYYYK